MNVTAICKETMNRLEQVHIGCFEGMDKPLLLISEQYPGIWLEHVYDSVFYAMQDPSKLYLAENTVALFLSHQTEDGQLPCYVWDGNKKKNVPKQALVGYSQIQECVSFAKLCWMVYCMNHDRRFLEKVYQAGIKWVGWLQNHRMTLHKGLVEMFVGYDTGHDNSGRLQGLSCQGNYRVDNMLQNAAVLPPDPVAPVIAVDMNCNYYATLFAISQMAHELGCEREAQHWEKQAAQVKEKLFALCFHREDCYFYDVDKHGNQRKYRSSTIFHLFMEGVLDKEKDANLIEEIYQKHIANPNEFATPYPYPSMAINDPSCKEHKNFNCWGYYTQGLIALRATLWMEAYGFDEAFQNLCCKWVEAWTAHFDNLKMGQELDPVTGIPTKSSEWYSSTMLFYLYAAKRIGKQR